MPHQHSAAQSLVSVVLLSVLFSSPILADTIGPLTPTGVVNFPFTGDAWATPGSSIGSDNVRATATTTSPGNVTDALHFSFSPGIPAGATIDGVEVIVEGQSGGSAIQPMISVAASSDGGTTFPFASGNTPSALPPGPSDSQLQFGNPSDTWGGLTTTDLNSGNFLVFIQCADFAAAFVDTYSIDDVIMFVVFTPAAAPSSSPLTIIVTVLSLAIAGSFGVWRIRRRARSA